LPVYEVVEGGFSCDVSKKEWVDVKWQIEDAYQFLLKHESELMALVTDCRVDDIRLDLPYYCRLDEQIFVQCDYFPANFLRLVGELGVGLELSLYFPAQAEGI
jgi:hypothetical protein